MPGTPRAAAPVVENLVASRSADAPPPSARAGQSVASPAAALPAPPASPPRTRTHRRGSFALITLATLLAIAATVSLGRWQLSRAAQKEALQAGIDARKLLPPIDQETLLAMGGAGSAPGGGVAAAAAADVASFLYRPVTLRGLWLAPQTVFLDNRQMHGRQGFYVLTPFAIEGTEQTVMVQRGWVQRNFSDRSRLEPVETPAGLVEVTGVVAPPPAHLLELGKAEPVAGAASATATTTASPAASSSSDAAPASEPAASASSAPSSGASASATVNARDGALAVGAVGSYPIRQNLSLQAFRTETRLPLRTDFSLQQTGAPSEGLQRDWPAPALGIDKHYGYAFQWFGLSVLVVVLYAWFQLIAPWRRRRRERRRLADRGATARFTQPNDPR
jgi:surfeit locus 1 family protein